MQSAGRQAHQATIGGRFGCNPKTEVSAEVSALTREKDKQNQWLNSSRGGHWAADTSPKPLEGD
jgi:hypothetical protein